MKKDYWAFSDPDCWFPRDLACHGGWESKVAFSTVVAVSACALWVVVAATTTPESS